MDTLAERLTYARTHRGLSQEELARRAGVKQGTIGNAESGIRKLPRELQAIADALDFRYRWLRYGELPMHADQERLTQSATVTIGGDIPDDEIVLVRESEVRFRGGDGNALEHELIEESEPAAYRLSWFRARRINPSHAIRFKADGDSNEPYIFHGDTILVNLDETEIRNGKVYAFWQAGHGRRIKRLFRDKRGHVTIKSFNPDYPDEELPAEEFERDVKIIGRVRDKSGDGGL